MARLIWRAISNLVDHEGFELSGYVAFTTLLALFPFLIFLAAVAGFLGDNAVADRFAATVLEFVPPAVASTLLPVVNDVLSHQHGDLLTFGIVATVWSASSGVEAVRTLLNRSYGAVETRPLWRRRLFSLFFVVMGSIAALLVSFAIFVAPILADFLHHIAALPPIDPGLLNLARYGFAAAVATVTLIALHLFLPNCRHRLRDVWPGAVVTTVLSLAAAALFSVYVSRFATTSVVYGSLGGIILTLLYFYLSSIILVFGAEINAALTDTDQCRTKK